VTPRRSAAAPGKTALARLRRELRAAAERQKATSEVLHLISSSSGDLQPVFATILANAVRLCEADNGIINRWDGDALHLVASHNLPAEFVALRQRAPYRPEEHSASGRMLATRSVIHIPDLAADRAYIERNPPTVIVVERAGVRTTLAVPMFKDSELVGSFTVGRTAVRPFTAKQIEVATSFADQAVIAVENARLLHELRETLEQQSATGDVLSIISRSTFDLQEVLDTLIELAAQLCDAELAAMHRLHGAKYRAIATYGGPPEHKALAGSVPFEPGRGSVIGRTMIERRPVHVAAVARRRSDRRSGADAALGPAVLGQADRAAAQFRRAGRHRHREYPAHQRSARAHRRDRPLDGRAAARTQQQADDAGGDGGGDRA
jgi:GAF domain-containing protein